MPREYVWYTPDSSDGERILRQHAYTTKKRGQFWEAEYEGNGALCDKRRGVADENERYVKISKLEAETPNDDNGCKLCLRIVNNMINA